MMRAAALLALAVAAACAKAPEPPVRVLMPRDEFVRLCAGKDYIDCSKAVGDPDRTQTSSGSSTEYWYWKRRTRDPRTGAPDLQVQVVIESGHVRAINFY